MYHGTISKHIWAYNRSLTTQIRLLMPKNKCVDTSQRVGDRHTHMRDIAGNAPMTEILQSCE